MVTWKRRYHLFNQWSGSGERRTMLTTYRKHNCRLAVAKIAAILTIILTFHTWEAVWSQNLLENSSFETGEETPSGWEVANSMPDHIVMLRDVEISLTGAASVRIESNSVGAAEYPAFKYLYQNVRPGEEYLGTVWARTENIQDIGGYVVIEYYNDNVRISFTQGNSTGSGSHDWQQLLVQGIVPAGANRIRLGLVAHGEGKVWFDDADLRASNLITNPSFEQGGITPTGWEVGNWMPAHIVMNRVTDVFRTGQASVFTESDSQGAQEYPAYKFTIQNVQERETYFGSAWMKTQGMQGLGGYIVLEFFDGTGRLSFAHDGRFTGTGNQDWMQLTVEGTVPQGTTHVKLGLVVHGEGQIWFDDAVLYLKNAPQNFSGSSISLSVKTDQILTENFLGFGAQGDYFLNTSSNTSRGIGDSDRQYVKSRVKKMRPDIMRTFFDYRWWEPTEGSHTPQNEYIQDYVKWAEFLETIDCQINLTPWGDWWAYPVWMRDGDRRLPRADKRSAMVRSLVDFIQYLREDKQLSNVSYVTLMNEPDNNPTTKPSVDDFVQMYHMLHQELTDRSLRDQVNLIGIDSSGWGTASSGEWFYEVSNRGLGYCDIAASHTYGFNVDMTSRGASLMDWIGSRTAALDAQAPSGQERIPFMIAEYNVYGDTFTSPHNHLYEHGLFLADFAIQSLQLGADSVLMWCLFDTYYTSDLKQEYGLWRYKVGPDTGTSPSYPWETWDPSWEAWQPRPGYYSFSLLTRYTQPGSRIIAIQTDPEADQFQSVALLSPEGKATILVVNQYDRSIEVSIDTAIDHTTNLFLYQYTPESIAAAAQDMIEASETISVQPGVPIQVTVPAGSFSVLTEFKDEDLILGWQLY